MRKKIEWQWEQLDEATWRAKVMGGWVLLHVKTFAITGKNSSMSQSESMQFIADRDHEWTIVPPIQAVEAAKPTVKADDFAPSK
jgi:hypothetical protein